MPPLIPILSTSITVVCSIVTTVINLLILYHLFISKTLKTSKNFTFFYVRFGVDVLLGIDTFMIMMFIFLRLCHFDDFLSSNPYFIFFTVWPNVNLTSLRTLLVTIITVDRFFAVFFAILFHQYRSKINNTVVVLIVLCYPVLDNSILWLVCQYPLIVPPGCVTFACLGDKCFIQYSLTFEVIAHSITALMSLLLAVKLFVINNCKNGSKSKDIERANRLALIESVIMAIFDIIPAAIQQKYHFQVEELGSVILFSKLCGYSLEGYLVYQTLKRRNEAVGSSSIGKNSMVKVKASVDK